MGVPDLKQAFDLMQEGWRLWEKGRLDDALAVLTASADADPTLPDPWLDIAGVLREKGPRNESDALDADRKFIELGSAVPELAAELAQAQARVNRANAWRQHYEGHNAWNEYNLKKSEIDRAKEIEHRRRREAEVDATVAKLQAERERLHVEQKKYSGKKSRRAIANSDELWHESVELADQISNLQQGLHRPGIDSVVTSPTQYPKGTCNQCGAPLDSDPPSSDGVSQPPPP